MYVQVSVQIVRRLRSMLLPLGLTLPDNVRAVRCHHSAAERNNGAWSWSLHLFQDLPSPEGPVSCIGSQWPMRDLVRCQDWSISRDDYDSVHVDPCTSCVRRVVAT